jgi:uncharacterized membrane protein
MVVAALYDWLLFFHVLMAIIWVGGGIALQILGTRIYRAGNRERLYEMAGDFEFVGTRVFTPASLLLLGLGIWMVIIGPWNFGMIWIDLGLVMFGYSFVSGAFYLGPQVARVKAIAATEGSGSQQVAVLIRRLFVVHRVELTFLVLIVLDMVTKPFL